MNKKQLEGLVEIGLSTRKIATEVGASQTNVRYYLKKFGLKTDIKKCNEKNCLCRVCGDTDFRKFNRSKNVCRKCHNKNCIENCRIRKKKAVEYKGGKCEMCGYDKCLGSLAFHHRDSNEKDPRWHNMRNWDLEKIKPELDKCILVCHNCHGEIHYENRTGEKT